MKKETKQKDEKVDPKVKTKRNQVSRKNPNAAFSLIELMIVLLVIGIIVSIALPSMLSANMAGRETKALANLRAISTEQAQYSTAWADGYAPSLAVLGPAAGTPTCNTAGLISSDLAAGATGQYNYTLVPGGTITNAPGNCTAPGLTDFMISAIPQVLNKSGRKSFCVASDGSLHVDPAGGAIADDATCLALAVTGTN